MLEQLYFRVNFNDAENNDSSFVGLGGMGFIDQLLSYGYKGVVRPNNMWELAESQVTVIVSPDMFSVSS